MLDRDLQLKILRTLFSIYPLAQDIYYNTKSNKEEIFNISYLIEHGLVTASLATSKDSLVIQKPKITAKGIDFLVDDGGLSAILGVITIKIHSDSIQALVDAKIDASPLPVESKSKLKEAIKNAPSTVVAEVLKRLTGMAFDHGPAALDYLQRVFLK